MAAKRSAKITLRVTRQVRALAEEGAKLDKRNLSNFCELAILERVTAVKTAAQSPEAVSA